LFRLPQPGHQAQPAARPEKNRRGSREDTISPSHRDDGGPAPAAAQDRAGGVARERVASPPGDRLERDAGCER
jgi:hypothetical protein